MNSWESGAATIATAPFMEKGDQVWLVLTFKALSLASIYKWNSNVTSLKICVNFGKILNFERRELVLIEALSSNFFCSYDYWLLITL